MQPLDIDAEKLPICKKAGDMTYIVEFSIGDLLFTWPSGRLQKIMAPEFDPNCWVSWNFYNLL